MPFFAVRYGHETRFSHAGTMKGAAHDAFGIVDEKRQTVLQLPGNPKYLSKKKLKPLLEQIELRHGTKLLIADGKAVEFKCDDCGGNIICEPPIPKPEPCLCGKCDPCQASLLDNKYYNTGKKVIHAAVEKWYGKAIEKGIEESKPTTPKTRIPDLSMTQNTNGIHFIRVEWSNGDQESVVLDIPKLAYRPEQRRELLNGIANILATLACHTK